MALPTIAFSEFPTILKTFSAIVDWQRRTSWANYHCRSSRLGRRHYLCCKLFSRIFKSFPAPALWTRCMYSISMRCLCSWNTSIRYMSMCAGNILLSARHDALSQEPNFAAVEIPTLLSCPLRYIWKKVAMTWSDFEMAAFQISRSTTIGVLHAGKHSCIAFPTILCTLWPLFQHDNHFVH